MEITPLTKIGPLLDAHPELEDPLIALVPVFERLRNPALRATAAKVATLEHAAKMGGIPLPELMAFLRQQLGQSEESQPQSLASDAAEAAWPAWYRPEAVVAELDATAMLRSGNHPLVAVQQTLGSHPPGAIVLVTSDFAPAPLLVQMAKEGILTACIQEGALFKTCLSRPCPAPST
jgi:hypothetical protein